MNLSSFWITLIGLTLSFNVHAEQLPYTQATFDALAKDGKPVLVEIHADWCPTCRTQGPIVKDLLTEKELAGITTLRVNFDNQKSVLKTYKVRQQSTLIGFKAGKEVGRSIGDTDKKSIRKLMLKTL
ncbi:MAG: thiol reductase thioredoxin [Methylotenera sp.]|nr:MAG: thiol reductase thioredoxin [Methylotenera sp.]